MLFEAKGFAFQQVFFCRTVARSCRPRTEASARRSDNAREELTTDGPLQKPNISSCASTGRPSKMLRHGRAPDAASHRSCLHVVNGVSRRGLPSHAWCCVSDCGHLRGGNWRCAALRDTSATDGLPWFGTFGTINWRAGSTRQHHQGRQPESPPCPDRGRLDLSLSSSPKPASTAATGELAQGRKGNSLESPGAVVCALSQVNGSRKAPDLNHDGDRTRDGGISVGDWSRGATELCGIR